MASNERLEETMSRVFYFGVTPAPGRSVDLDQLRASLEAAYGSDPDSPCSFTLVDPATLRVQAPTVPLLTNLGPALARWVEAEVGVGVILHLWGQGGRIDTTLGRLDLLDEDLTIQIRMHAGADVLRR